MEIINKIMSIKTLNKIILLTMAYNNKTKEFNNNNKINSKTKKRKPAKKAAIKS